MNPSLALPSPLLPPEEFLTQCSALNQSILSRLQCLVERPASEREKTESPAADLSLTGLECASRIVRRLQDTYLSAQKAITEMLAPNHAAKEPQAKTKSWRTVDSLSTLADISADSPTASQSLPVPPATAAEAIDNVMAAVKALNAVHPVSPVAHAPESEGEPSDFLVTGTDGDDFSDEGASPVPAPYADPVAAPLEEQLLSQPALSGILKLPFRPPLTRTQKNKKKAARRDRKRNR